MKYLIYLLAAGLIGLSAYSLFGESVMNTVDNWRKGDDIEAVEMAYMQNREFTAQSVVNYALTTEIDGQAVDAPEPESPDKENYRDFMDGSLPDSGDTAFGIISVDDVGLKEPVYTGPATPEQLDKGVSLVEGDESLSDQNVAIAGHRVEGKDIHFNQLAKAKEGMDVKLKLVDHTRTYKITRIHSVDPGETEILAEYDGPDRLTLITCDDYDYESGLFMTRTVFVAELVSVDFA